MTLKGKSRWLLFALPAASLISCSSTPAGTASRSPDTTGTSSGMPDTTQRDYPKGDVTTPGRYDTNPGPIGAGVGAESPDVDVMPTQPHERQPANRSPHAE